MKKELEQVIQDAADTIESGLQRIAEADYNHELCEAVRVAGEYIERGLNNVAQALRGLSRD